MTIEDTRCLVGILQYAEAVEVVLEGGIAGTDAQTEGDPAQDLAPIALTLDIELVEGYGRIAFALVLSEHFRCSCQAADQDQYQRELLQRGFKFKSQKSGSVSDSQLGY